MNQPEFLRLVDACLAKVSKRLEDFDSADLDYTTGDGMLTIEFPDGSRFIMSRQTATSQIWLAADAHAFHYSYDAGRDAWLDDKDSRRAPRQSGGAALGEARSRPRIVGQSETII